MKVNEFINQILEASAKFSWIKRVDTEKLKTRAKIRLWTDQAFIDIYYNAEDEITSYAYVESGRRTFGANNMRMGWHLHPFERVEEHKPIEPLSIGRFLQMLENELKKRRKI